MTFDEIVEYAKNVNGIVTGGLVFLEEKLVLLPLNPRIRDEWAHVAALLALVTGFGAHRYAKKTGRQRLGWVSVGLTVITSIVIIWLARTASISPQSASDSARVAYVLFFIFVGSAVGGFLT